MADQCGRPDGEGRDEVDHERRAGDTGRPRRDAQAGGLQRQHLEVVLHQCRVEGVEGRVSGTLARTPRGSNGFGYDPVFVPDGDTRTLAEYTDVEKNAISHRGNAFRALEPVLRELLRGTAG